MSDTASRGSSSHTTTEVAASERPENEKIPEQHDEEQTAQSEHDLEKRRRKERIARIFTFFSLQLSLFLAALDNTIVATSLPKIGSEFQAMTISSWIVNSYILTFDAFQPLLSKFSDIFGRKWILVSGIVLFLIGSVLCGAAQNMIWLIVCRAIQGIGGAGIFSMVFVIVSDLVPLEKRGAYQGVITAVFALSSVCGPLIGGSLTDYVSWRWNFYINLPVAGAALTIVIIFLHLPVKKEAILEKFKRIDYLGNLLVLAAATLFLLALNFGGQTFPWASAAVIVPLVLSGLLVAVLVFVEIKLAKEPLMPPRLFKRRSVVAILLLNVFSGITFFAVIYYMPIYFQIVRADSATWSGIRLIPMQMLICVSSAISGFTISKFEMYRPQIWYGLTLVTLGVGLLHLLEMDTPWSKIYGFTVIIGAGQGAVFSGTIIGIQAAAEPRDIAVVTGLNNFSRVLGGALGVAIASATLNSSLNKDLPQVLPPDLLAAVLEYPEAIRSGSIPEQYVQPVLDIYLEGLHTVYLVLTAMSGVSLLSSFLIKANSVRARPGPKKGPQQQEQQPEQRGGGETTDKAATADITVIDVPPAAAPENEKREVTQQENSISHSERA